MSEIELREQAEAIVRIRKKNKIVNLFKALAELLDENLPDVYFSAEEQEIMDMMDEIEGDISSQEFDKEMVEMLTNNEENGENNG